MIIGSLGVCPAICGSQRESLKEGISGLHLKYLRVRASVEIVKGHLVRIRIHIDNDLFQEVGVIVFQIQVQRLPEKRDISRYACSIIPSLFLIEMIGDAHLAAACHQIIILGKHMVGAISLSGGKTEMNKVIGVVLNVRTRSHKESVLTAMVATKSGHQHELIIQVEGILCVGPAHRFTCKSFRQRCFSVIGQSVMLVVSVIIIAEACR